MTLVRRLYGRHPIHLVLVLAAFAIAGAAMVHFFDAGPPRTLALWLGGAIVLHDLVLFPVYAVADRAAVAAGARARAQQRPSVTNYLRVPTVLSGLLLAISFPLILGLAEHYEDTTGLSLEPFLGRWLGLSGAMFAASALLYGVALVRGRRRPAA